MPTVFTISTPLVTVTWSWAGGKRMDGASLQMEVEALGAEDVDVERVEDHGLQEQTDYTLLVQSAPGHRVAVHHADPVVVRRLHAASDGSVVHGTVNFGTQVGFSRFVVALDGSPHVAFEVEVWPSKLDYKDDFTTLCSDVQDVAAGLVFAHLRTTFQYGMATSTAADEPGAIPWLRLLEHGLDDLEAALLFIDRQPLHTATRAPRLERRERIRRPDALVRRALRQATPATPTLPTHAISHGIDTPAHRWLASALKRCQQRLDALQRAERQRRPSLRRAQTLDVLTTLQTRIERLADLAFLRDLSDDAPPSTDAPMQLLQAPGYREAYQACLLLRYGLDLQGDVLTISLKDLHALYEMWCFLTLVRLTAALLRVPLPARELVAIEQHGLSLSLRHGQAQTLTFALPGGGTLQIAYNPHFGGRTFLVPQRPDIVLTRTTPGGQRTRYVLDAKYRLDVSPGYVRRYGTPGPPTDALNTLHRYRDALRTDVVPVVQAAALFPYRETEPGLFAQHRHHQALQTLGIGAIPLLPGHTRYLAEWLKEVLFGIANAQSSQ